MVRVLITCRDGHVWWNTVGLATDIIEASWQALVDSITYKLFRDEQGLNKRGKRRSTDLPILLKKLWWVVPALQA